MVLAELVCTLGKGKLGIGNWNLGLETSGGDCRGGIGIGLEGFVASY